MSRYQIQRGQTFTQTATNEINKLFKRIDETFNPSVGIQLDADTWYNPYNKSGALEIIIASGSVVGNGAILPIVLDGTTPTVTGATLDPDSVGTARSTNGVTDEYTFIKKSTGIVYSIKNL